MFAIDQTTEILCNMATAILIILGIAAFVTLFAFIEWSMSALFESKKERPKFNFSYIKNSAIGLILVLLLSPFDTLDIIIVIAVGFVLFIAFLLIRTKYREFRRRSWFPNNLMSLITIAGVSGLPLANTVFLSLMHWRIFRVNINIVCN